MTMTPAVPAILPESCYVMSGNGQGSAPMLPTCRPLSSSQPTKSVMSRPASSAGAPANTEYQLEMHVTSKTTAQAANSIPELVAERGFTPGSMQPAPGRAIHTSSAPESVRPPSDAPHVHVTRQYTAGGPTPAVAAKEAAAKPDLPRVSIPVEKVEPPLLAPPVAAEGLGLRVGPVPGRGHSANSSPEQTAGEEPAEDPNAGGAKGLPPPVVLSPAPWPCLRGMLRVDGASGVHLCTGRWGMSLEAHTSNGITSPFEFKHVPASPSEPFPHCGTYRGYFMVSQDNKPALQVDEKDLNLSFRSNSAGFWNVDGHGRNRYGLYTVWGTLERDGLIQLYRQYEAKSAKPKKRSAPSGGWGGQTVRMGSADGDGPATPPGCSSSGLDPPGQAAKPLPRAPAALSYEELQAGPAKLQGLMRQCRTLLTQLMSVKNRAQFFTQPVDPIALGIPDYPLIIQHPLDLGTIKARMDGGQYYSHEDFVADVRLVFSNAITYNTGRHQNVLLAAQELSRLFEQRLALILADDAKPVLRKKKATPAAPTDPAAEAAADGAAAAAKRKAGAGGSSDKPAPLKRPRTSGTSRPGPRPKDDLGAPANTEAVPVNELVLMQRQMEDMQRTIAYMQQMELDLPRTALGLSAMVSQPAPADLPLTNEEKRQLSEDINALDESKVARVVSIIHRTLPLDIQAAQNGQEIELEVDALDVRTLRELQRFVETALQPKRKKRAKGKGLIYESESDNDWDM